MGQTILARPRESVSLSSVTYLTGTCLIQSLVFEELSAEEFDEVGRRLCDLARLLVIWAEVAPEKVHDLQEIVGEKDRRLQAIRKLTAAQLIRGSNFSQEDSDYYEERDFKGWIRAHEKQRKAALANPRASNPTTRGSCTGRASFGKHWNNAKEPTSAGIGTARRSGSEKNRRNQDTLSNKENDPRPKQSRPESSQQRGLLGP